MSQDHDGRLVADEESGTVMYEHSETWTFGSSGQVVNAAAPDWLERLGDADTSGVLDATGVV